MGVLRQDPHTRDTNAGPPAAVPRRRVRPILLRTHYSLDASSLAFCPSDGPGPDLPAVSSSRGSPLRYSVRARLQLTLPTFLSSVLRRRTLTRSGLLPRLSQDPHFQSTGEPASSSRGLCCLPSSSPASSLRVLSVSLARRSLVGTHPPSPRYSSSPGGWYIGALHFVASPGFAIAPPAPSSYSGSPYLLGTRSCCCPIVSTTSSLSPASTVSSFSPADPVAQLVRLPPLPPSSPVSISSPVTVFSASLSAPLFSRSLSTTSSPFCADPISSQAPKATSSIALPSVRLLLRLARFVDRHPSLLFLLSPRLRFSSERHPSLDAVLSLILNPSPFSLYVPLPRLTSRLQPQAQHSSGSTSLSSPRPSFALPLQGAPVFPTGSAVCPNTLVRLDAPQSLAASPALAATIPPVALKHPSEDLLTYREESWEAQQKRLKRNLPPAGPLSPLFRQYLRSSWAGKEENSGSKFTVSHVEGSLDFIWASIRLLSRLRHCAFDYCRRLETPLPLLPPTSKEFTGVPLGRASSCTRDTHSAPCLPFPQSGDVDPSHLTTPAGSSSPSFSPSTVFVTGQKIDHQAHSLLHAALWHAGEEQPHLRDELSGLLPQFTGHQQSITTGEPGRFAPWVSGEDSSGRTGPVPVACLEESVSALLLPRYSWRNENEQRRYASALHVLYLSKYARSGCGGASAGVRERTDRRSRDRKSKGKEDEPRTRDDGAGRKDQRVIQNGTGCASSDTLEPATVGVSHVKGAHDSTASSQGLSSVRSAACSSEASSLSQVPSPPSLPRGSHSSSPEVSSFASASFLPPASRTSSSPSSPIYVSSVKRGQLLVVHPLTFEATWSRAVVLITHVSRKGYVEGVILNKRRAWLPGDAFSTYACNGTPPAATRDEGDFFSRTGTGQQQSSEDCTLDPPAAVLCGPRLRTEETEQAQRQGSPFLSTPCGDGSGVGDASVRAYQGVPNSAVGLREVVENRSVGSRGISSSGCENGDAGGDLMLCSGVVSTSYSSFLTHFSSQLSLLQAAKKCLQSPEVLAAYLAGSGRQESGEIPPVPRGDREKTLDTSSTQLSTEEARPSFPKTQHFMSDCSPPSAAASLLRAMPIQSGSRPQEPLGSTVGSALLGGGAKGSRSTSQEESACLQSSTSDSGLSPELVATAKQLISRAITALLLHRREAVFDRAEGAEMLHVIMEELCTDAVELVNYQRPPISSPTAHSSSIQAADLYAEAPYLLELLQWFADGDADKSSSGSAGLRVNAADEEESCFGWNRDDGIYFSGVYFPPRTGGRVSRAQGGDRENDGDKGNLVQGETETDRDKSTHGSSTKVASVSASTAPQESPETSKEASHRPVLESHFQQKGLEGTAGADSRERRPVKEDDREKQTVQELKLDPLLTFLAHLPMGKVTSEAAFDASRRSRRQVALSRLRSVVSRMRASRRSLDPSEGKVFSPRKVDLKKEKKAGDKSTGETRAGAASQERKVSKETADSENTKPTGVSASGTSPGLEADTKVTCPEQCVPQVGNLPAVNVLDRPEATGVSASPEEISPTQRVEPAENEERCVRGESIAVDTAGNAGADVECSIGRTGREPVANDVVTIAKEQSGGQNTRVGTRGTSDSRQKESDGPAEGDGYTSGEERKEGCSRVGGIWTRYSFGGPVLGYTILHTHAQAGVVEVHKGVYLGTKRKGDRKATGASSPVRSDPLERSRGVSSCDSVDPSHFSDLTAHNKGESVASDRPNSCGTLRNDPASVEPGVQSGRAPTGGRDGDLPDCSAGSGGMTQNDEHSAVAGPRSVSGIPESCGVEGFLLPEVAVKTKEEQEYRQPDSSSSPAEDEQKQKSAISTGEAAAQDAPDQQISDVFYRSRRFLGKAAWRPGQLEREIARGMWVLVGCTDAAVMQELVFDDAEAQGDEAGAAIASSCQGGTAQPAAFHKSEAGGARDEDDLWRRILTALSVRETAGVDSHMYAAMARVPICLVKHVEDQFREDEDADDDDSDEDEAEY
ncbi:acr-like protein [Cystoisospora suis]|uniref:Acr-like protein n=1 Tax=Cystoisospora suis TaxID=483139 RepID=A0A2C6KEC8_9APIC|nr:acr-like protein [Cystoisospora suis]